MYVCIYIYIYTYMYWPKEVYLNPTPGLRGSARLWSSSRPTSCKLMSLYTCVYISLSLSLYIYIYIHVYIYIYIYISGCSLYTYILTLPGELPASGEMRGAPGSPAAGNHFLVWIVKPSGCHCTDGHLTSRVLTEEQTTYRRVPNPLRSMSPFTSVCWAVERDSRRCAAHAMTRLLGCQASLSFYVSMYPCIYVSMYPCIYVSMYLCIYVSMYICMYVCMSVCMYVCMYVCM